MINNRTLVTTLACVKLRIQGIGASRGAGHFPKEQYVCNTGYNTVPLTLVLAYHDVVNVG